MKINLNKTEKICLVILLLGSVARILYAIKMPYNCSPHDVGIFSTDSYQDYCHIGLIQYIYEHKAFPDTYRWQFYQAPLFHIVGACMMALFHYKDTYVPAMEMLQNVNMLMSCIATFYGYRILKKVCKKESLLCTAAAFITFCPIFFIIGAELNNDCFAATFQIMAIYYTIVWMEQQKTGNILKIAAFIILATLSKASGVIVSFGIGACFLYYLFVNHKEWKKYFTQYSIFGIVCIPLSLSWMIYRNITVGMPFTYVPRMPDTHPQYVGWVSRLRRLAFPYHMKLNYNCIDFADTDFHSNIWTQLFYTMNYDEGNIAVNESVLAKWLYIAMFYISVILTLVLAACVLRNLLSKNVEMKYKLIIGASACTFLASFVKFAFDYPFICTMNFRYIAITPILLFAGYIMDYRQNQLSKAVENVVKILVMLQSVFMVILYLVYPKI